jgi:hypothetical protein
MNGFCSAAARRALHSLGLLAGVAALSAACGSSGTPGPTPTAVAGSGAASATPTGGAGGGASVSASSTAAATAPSGNAAAGTTCLVRYLHGDVKEQGVAAGSVYINITFKNLNNQPCTLYGFPGVSAGNGTPVTQVGQPANRDMATSPTTVALAPGGYAYATLQIANALNYSAADCKPASTSWLLVYPPNTSNLLYVPYTTKVCTTSTVNMSVQAVQAGNGG